MAKARNLRQNPTPKPLSTIQTRVQIISITSPSVIIIITSHQVTTPRQISSIPICQPSITSFQTRNTATLSGRVSTGGNSSGWIQARGVQIRSSGGVEAGAG